MDTRLPARSPFKDGQSRGNVGAPTIERTAFEHVMMVVELDDALRITRFEGLVKLATGRDCVGLHLREVLTTGADEFVRDIEQVMRSGRGAPVHFVGERVVLHGICEPVFEGGRVRGTRSILVDASPSELGSSIDRLRFEQLLAGLAELLLRSTSDDLADTLSTVLEKVATSQGFDCAMLRAEDGGRVDTHVWSADPELGARVAPLLDLLKADAALDEGKPRCIDSADPFPDGTPKRALLDAAGIRGFCAFPLRDQPHGAIVFLSKVERRTTHPLRHRVGLVTELISSSLHRRRVDRQAAAAVEARVAFERMISSLAASFVNCPAQGIDDAISKALVDVASTLALVRGAVVRSTAGGRVQVTHATPGEWLVATQPLAAVLSNPKVTVDLLRADTSVVVKREHLTSLARKDWDATGVRTVTVVPLLVAGEVYGALLLATKSDAIGDALGGHARLIADVIAQALARKRAESERADAFAQLAARKASAERERDYLREQMRSKAFIAESAIVRKVLESTKVVAPTSATVLIRGETGVGKEVLARTIHEWSDRAEGPLVRVNCASIPRELFESEFFGHVRGAFTGAHRDRVGRFELADGGTLFLDEIGEVPLELQAKLLRVLQEGELERVGDDRTRKVDVRVVAATNRDLEREVEAGRFRSDLYYRLAVFPIVLPPLRERREDIVPLARHLLTEHSRRVGRGHLELTGDDQARLMEYPWPGNVRELANVIERAVILCTNDRLALDLALPAAPVRLRASSRPEAPPRPTESNVKTSEELRAFERENLVRALDAAHGQVAGRGGAAERLGVSPSTLRDRMRSLGVSFGRQRRSEAI
ncbi:MAG: sigma 54-interacting transcriptional regulator [Polyangiales bacterium]